MPPKRARDSLARPLSKVGKATSVQRTTTSISGILGLNLLAADRGDGVVGGDRGLAHADRDQRDLAGIAGDVAGGIDPRQVRLAAGRVDLDLTLALELEAPVGDRAEMRVKAEQRDQRVALDLLALAALRVLDRDGADVAVAVDLAHLVRGEDLDPALGLELLSLVHRRLERPEVVAAVDERDRVSGCVLEAERPVERAVAAADDHTRSVAENILLAHEVVEALALPDIDVVDPELARLEGPVARGDDQRPAQEGAALVRGDREELFAVLAQTLERLDFLAQSHLGAVLEPLLGAEIDQCLTLDLRIAGDVVHVLLRINGGDLTADLLEALDDPNGRVTMARVVRGGEAGRAGTEDRNVDDVAHATKMLLAVSRLAGDVAGQATRSSAELPTPCSSRRERHAIVGPSASQ